MSLIIPTSRQAQALSDLQRALDGCRTAGVALMPDADAPGPAGVSVMIRRGRRWTRVGVAILPAIPAPAVEPAHVIGVPA